MKRFLWLLIILLIAVVIGIVVAQMHGYVLISLGATSVTAPLWLAVIAFIVACIIVYFVVRFIRLLYLVPKGWRLSFLKSRAQKRENTLKAGLNAFLVGDFQTAKKRFKELANHLYMAPETWLMTSRSAALAGERAESIDALHQASKLRFKDRSALILLEVDSLLEEGRMNEASVKLQPLVQSQPKSLPVIRRSLDIEKRRNNWNAVIDLLPRFKKAADMTQMNDQMIEAYRGLFHQADSEDRARAVWSEVPKNLQGDVAMIASYVRTLGSFKAYDRADQLLTKTLNHDFNAGLFVEYSLLPLIAAVRLKQGEEWFEKHAPSAESLYAMGNLYAQSQVGAKARQCFERALAMNPTADLKARLVDLLK